MNTKQHKNRQATYHVFAVVQQVYNKYFETKRKISLESLRKYLSLYSNLGRFYTDSLSEFS